MDSSSVAAVGYEPGAARLLIRFRSSGDLYAYYDVPRSVFVALQAASSKGRYVNAEIKGRYRYERVKQRANRPRSARGVSPHATPD